MLRMANFETKIALQHSRFKLIEDAADVESEPSETELSRQLINTRLETLEQNWSRFQTEHESLCYSQSDVLSQHEYMRTKVFERCHAFYVHSKACLLARKEGFVRSSTQSRSRSRSMEPRQSTSLLPRSALPRINLPRFSGNYHSWAAFRDLFTSLIRNNTDLSNVEKMHYLRTSLTDEAARLVSNLSLSGDHFSLAWQTLCSRYDNQRIIIDFQLDRISNIKPLRVKSAQGLRTLSSTLTEVLGALRALDCPVQHWDIPLLNQSVKLLAPETREAWEDNLGSSTSYPSFTVFEQFLVGRARALESMKPAPSPPTNQTSRHGGPVEFRRHKIATHHVMSSETQDPKKCPSCQGQHPLQACPEYQKSTVEKRRELVIKFRRCFNCLGNHIATRCMSTRRCLQCGKRHHSSLHGVESSTRKSSFTANINQTKKDPTSTS